MLRRGEKSHFVWPCHYSNKSAFVLASKCLGHGTLVSALTSGNSELPRWGFAAASGTASSTGCTTCLSFLSKCVGPVCQGCAQSCAVYVGCFCRRQRRSWSRRRLFGLGLKPWSRESAPLPSQSAAFSPTSIAEWSGDARFLCIARSGCTSRSSPLSRRCTGVARVACASPAIRARSALSQFARSRSSSFESRYSAGCSLTLLLCSALKGNSIVL